MEGVGEELGGRVDVFVAIPLGISRIEKPGVNLVDFFDGYLDLHYFV